MYSAAPGCRSQPVVHRSIDTDGATRQRSGMRWDERLGGLFDDLEQQAEGLALVERDAEVAEQSRAEYAQVDLAGRALASTGRRLLVAVAGVGRARRNADPRRRRLVAARRRAAGVARRDRRDRLGAGPLRPRGGRRGAAGHQPAGPGLGAAGGGARPVAEAVLHGRDGSVVRGVSSGSAPTSSEVRVGEGRGHLVTLPVRRHSPRSAAPEPVQSAAGGVLGRVATWRRPRRTCAGCSSPARPPRCGTAGDRRSGCSAARWPAPGPGPGPPTSPGSRPRRRG